MYNLQMKKINKYKWNPLLKNNSISITSILSIATEDKPKMIIESYTSNDKQFKYPEAMYQSQQKNYNKIKNETEKFIYNKVNEVNLSNQTTTSIDSVNYKNNVDNKLITSKRTQCSLIRKKIFESEVTPDPNSNPNPLVVNRSSTPLTYRNHIKQGNDYIDNKNKDIKMKSNPRDVSAGLVYEQTKEYQFNNINIDHMIMLEDKLIEILSAIPKKKSTSMECYEWWSYYFNSSLCEECYEEFFNNNKSSQVIIHTANNLELFSVILCFFISINTSNCNKFNIFFSKIFYYLHINYLLICKVMVEKSRMKIYSKQKKLWLNKVNENLNQQLKTDKDKDKDYDDMNIALKIKNNCKVIVQDIKSILSHFTHIGICDNIIQTFNNLTRLTNDDLNEFFKKHIYKKEQINEDNSKHSHNVNNNNNNNANTIIPPFIKTKPIKPYTLVLDLDETLVSSKIINISSGKGKVKFRPGLIEFLTRLKDFYEIISFTAANKEVSN